MCDDDEEEEEVGMIVFIPGIKLIIKVVRAETSEGCGGIVASFRSFDEAIEQCFSTDMTNSVKAIVLYMLCRSEIRVGSSFISMIGLYRLHSEAIGPA